MTIVLEVGITVTIPPVAQFHYVSNHVCNVSPWLACSQVAYDLAVTTISLLFSFSLFPSPLGPIVILSLRSFFGTLLPLEGADLQRPHHESVPVWSTHFNGLATVGPGMSSSAGRDAQGSTSVHGGIVLGESDLSRSLDEKKLNAMVGKSDKLLERGEWGENKSEESGSGKGCALS